MTLKEKISALEQLKYLRDEVDMLSQRIAELEDQMGLPEVYANPEEAARVAREHRQAQEQLDALYEMWEELEGALG